MPNPGGSNGAGYHVGPFGATLNGGAGGAFGAWFDYGLTTTYDNSTPVFGFPGQCYGGYSIAVSELTCSTQYHFRAVVQGYGGIAHGDDAVFTTLPCPAPTS